MRSMFVLMAALTLSAGAASAQDAFPVTLGVGGGAGGGAAHPYHGLVLVEVAAPRYPVAFRLDGLLTPPGNRVNTDMFSAISASAIVTLRPWRVSPYLVVGATRVSEYAYPNLLSTGFSTVPARTQLTGGLGLGLRLGRARVFGEMRTLQDGGTPLTFGVKF